MEYFLENPDHLWYLIAGISFVIELSIMGLSGPLLFFAIASLTTGILVSIGFVEGWQSEVLTVGDEINVKVLKYDPERTRVSLGLKQLMPDPWEATIATINVGDKKTALVTNVTEYGCFAQIAEGIEGLVHVSEMDWAHKNIHPSKVVKVGQEVDVMVLAIDKERRRISLGIKQCQQNPWDAFAEKYKKGDKLTGCIKSITDFGVFLGLDGDIDGLIHLSDLSWDLPGEEAVKQYHKGDEVEAVIVSIDIQRARIALSIKQLQPNPVSGYASTEDKGLEVQGAVTAVDKQQEKKSVQQQAVEAAGPTTIGDLIKQQMNK